MLSSITSTCVGTTHAPRSMARLYAAAASRTRSATAAMTGVSAGATVRGMPLACALTMTFISPCRYSSTSRDRCRAIGRKPIISSTWPSACGLDWSIFDELDAVQPERIAGVDDEFAVGSSVMAPPARFRLLWHAGRSRRPARRRGPPDSHTFRRTVLDLDSGSARSRLPVAAASALATAGAITGTPGSPTPDGLSVDATMCTSTAGISLIRSSG